MAASGTFAFADPQAYQAAVHPSRIELFVTARGDFRAELTRVELARLWLRRGRERMPRVVHSTVSTEPPPIFLLASDQATVHQMVFGHLTGIYVLKHQPAKFAAIEARWTTQQPASEVLIALPDPS